MGLLGALLLAATSAFAADHLLYLEAQGVAGYDFRDREVTAWVRAKSRPHGRLGWPLSAGIRGVVGDDGVG